MNPVRRYELPKMYGTLAWKIMLAHNMVAGWRTVWHGEGDAFGLWWAHYNGATWDVVRPVAS